MINELKSICEIKENFDLKKYNTFKLECTTKYFIEPNNEEELIKIIDILNNNKSKYMIIGNASNIILPPYYDGVIIKLTNLNSYRLEDDIVYCEAGCMLNKLANEITSKGYSGLDFAVGVPGTIGGAVYGNAGCYGSSIGEVLISATIYNGKDIVELDNSKLDFKYRYSILKEKKDWIVLSCKFKVEESNLEELKALVLERTNKRIASQDLSHPSNGSVFRNPEGYASGKLIDDLGLKGYKIGGAMVSYKHANFIINEDNATQEDILKLIDKIKKDVKDNYDIDLILEQEIIK